MTKFDKLKFVCNKSEGEFDWGKSRSELFERLCDADRREFLAIIKEDPEFIEAYNSLGFIEIDNRNYGLAFMYFQDAFNIGNSLIPKNFRGNIIWAAIDNRPFLTAIQGLGLSFMYSNEFEQAIKFFEMNLKYNPNDNQGIRTLATQCYIATGNLKKILNICLSFSDDILVDIIYGKIWALYYLGELDKAKKTLQRAITDRPLVAEELIAENHILSYNRVSENFYIGSIGEAYDYWKRTGQYWTNPKLKEFVKNGLKISQDDKKKSLNSHTEYQ